MSAPLLTRQTVIGLLGLAFRTLLGATLAFGGFYIAIEEQHKTTADWHVQLAGLVLGLLGLFTAPYAGDAIATGGKKLGAFGRRGYDDLAAAKAGTPEPPSAP